MVDEGEEVAARMGDLSEEEGNLNSPGSGA